MVVRASVAWLCRLLVVGGPNPQAYNLSVFGRWFGCKACSRMLQSLMFSKGQAVPSGAHFGNEGISEEPSEFNDQATAGDGGRKRAR